MKKHQYTPLLNPVEVEKIFSSGHLYETQSFFVIDPKTRHYRIDTTNESFIEKSQRIRSSFLDGSTIIVKNLETYSSKLKEFSLQFSPMTTIHMYLTPHCGGTSFDYHTDNTDVFVHVNWGEKVFELKNEGGDVETYSLNAGEGIHIPKGTLHRASAKGHSCLLSFGYVEISDYAVPPAIMSKDFD